MQKKLTPHPPRRLDSNRHAGWSPRAIREDHVELVAQLLQEQFMGRLEAAQVNGTVIRITESSTRLARRLESIGDAHIEQCDLAPSCGS